MSVARVTTIVSVVVILGIDVWLALSGQETISQSIWAIAAKQSIIPFLAGLLCGHLFFR